WCVPATFGLSHSSVDHSSFKSAGLVQPAAAAMASGRSGGFHPPYARWRNNGRRSSVDHPSFQCEEALRTLLDEQNDQREDQDLAEHGADLRLQQLVGDA